MNLEGLPANLQKALLANHKDKPLASLTPAQVLVDYDSLGALGIAEKYGISHQAVYRWLLANCPDEYRRYQSSKRLAKLDVNEAALDGADSNVAVSRVREQVKLNQWYLERLLPSLFAPKQEVAHTHSGPLINIVLSDITSK